MTDTPLDTAHIAMDAQPDNDTARLQFYERLADSELFLLLEKDADGDQIEPRLFDTEELRLVLVFDREHRLTAFAEGPAPYAALSGRSLVDMLDGQEGIRRSYKEGGGARSRREQLDAEALRFGLRASTREFGEVCWRQTQERIMDRRLLEEIQSKSLAAGTGATGALEARLVEEAKRESLRTARASYRSTVEEEARLLEEVKRESLRPPPATEGESMFEDAPRPGRLERPVEHPSTAAAAAVGDGATDLVQNSDDDYSSFVAFLDDRRPAAKKLSPNDSRKSGSS